MSPMYPFSACVSGMVIHVEPDSMKDVIERLQRDSHITLGARFDATLAVVLETPAGADPEEAYRHLAQVPGIVQADLVYAHWLEEDAAAAVAQEHPAL